MRVTGLLGAGATLTGALVATYFLLLDLGEGDTTGDFSAAGFLEVDFLGAGLAAAT